MKFILLAALFAIGEACFGEFHTKKTVTVGSCSTIEVTTVNDSLLLAQTAVPLEHVLLARTAVPPGLLCRSVCLAHEAFCAQYYCFMFPKMCHKAIATETVSGISMRSGPPYDHWSCGSQDGFDTNKDYVEATALYRLFNKALVHNTTNTTDTCNCEHKDQKVRARATTCSMFNQTTDVPKKAFSYRAWATDLTTTNKVSDRDKYATAAAAEVAALADLVKKYPSEAKCHN